MPAQYPHAPEPLPLAWRLRRPLLAHTLRLTEQDRHWAEDVVQETLLRAWRNEDELSRDPELLRSWLFTVARRIVIDNWRCRQSRPHEVSLPGKDIWEPRDGIELMLSRITLATALRRLGGPYREAVRETYLRGQSIREAAEALGVPPGTMKSRLRKALSVLRTVLREPI